MSDGEEQPRASDQISRALTSCSMMPTSKSFCWARRWSRQTKLSSFFKNGSFYDVDRGADPDYTISEPEKYYDRQALTDYINTIF